MTLQYLAIILEVLVVVVAVLIANKKKRSYGWLLALAYAIYAYSDYTRINGGHITTGTRDLLFFVASAAVFWVTWTLYTKHSN